MKKLKILLISSFILSLSLSCTENIDKSNIFQEVTDFPIIYSFRNDSMKSTLRALMKDSLSRDTIKQLIPNIKLESTERLYAIHCIKKGDYSHYSFFIQNDAYPDFYCSLLIITYDQKGDIISHLEKMLIYDEYGSYLDVNVISPDTLYTINCYAEYSPDEESYLEDIKNGYEFVPTAVKEEHHFVLDSSKFLIYNSKDTLCSE